MKIQEIAVSKDLVIWHGTSSKFKTFKPSTAWFHLTRDEGIGAAFVTGDSRCYLMKCKLSANVKIATEKQAQKILDKLSAQYGIEDEYMYSMLDTSVKEFDPKFIAAFKDALMQAGYSAAYMEDESHLDPGGPSSTRSIAVFRPDRDVKILETISGEKLQTEHEKLLGLHLPDFLAELTQAEPPPQDWLSSLESWLFGQKYNPIRKARMSDPDTKTVEFLKNLADEDVLAWGKPEHVDPRDLWTFQWTVSKRKLTGYGRDPGAQSENNYYGLPESLPAVASYNGYMVILDGNHRCAAALLRGEQIRVWLVDCDALERSKDGNA